MFIIKDSPVLDIAEVFRPFHWGYLLLGSSRGLAFYWSARIVVLFLSTYELFLLITKKTSSTLERTPRENNEGKILSLVGASLITFSPLVQWWFAVNSLPEMIIAISVSVVCMDRYLTATSTLRRIIYFSAITVCGGMFILSLYPAWQIPLFYILLILIIDVVRKHFRHIHIPPHDILWTLLIATIGIALLLHVAFESKETIMSTLSTEYPGRRHSTGGDLEWRSLFSGIGSIFLSVKNYVGTSNPTEASGFIDLFPIGIILFAINVFRTRRIRFRETSLLLLIILYITYQVVGLPLWFCQITLLTATTAKRMTAVVGIANIILLISEASIFTHQKRRDPRLKSHTANNRMIILLISTIGAATIAILTHEEFSSFVGIILTFIVALLVFFTSLLLLCRQSLIKIISGIIVLPAVILSGLFVNPIQYSISPMTDQPLIAKIRALSTNTDSTWITEGDNSNMLANLFTANGIKTLNALSVTPKISTWEKIDPHHRYTKIYNRYAFAAVSIVPESQNEIPFSLIWPDLFSVSLTIDQLKILGVDFVASTHRLDDISSKTLHFESLSSRESNGRYLYRIIKN
nr:hypothetical protein [Bifidobacterium minimum]